MKKIAIFASGSGSNAENIIRFFAKNPEISVNSIFCNVPGAYVLERAKKYHIPAYVFNREEMKNPEKLLCQLKEQEIDFIVLAGFLWLMPSCITAAYPNRIINIHPALLPKFGGKGFYGLNVHKAVLAAGETESGATVHYVDAGTDTGQIIRQTRVPVEPGDTPETLAARVLEAEHRLLPEVVADLCREKANKTL